MTFVIPLCRMHIVFVGDPSDERAEAYPASHNRLGPPFHQSRRHSAESLGSACARVFRPFHVQKVTQP